MSLLLPKTPQKTNYDSEALHRLYNTVTKLSRSPVFYTRFAVPDTTDGRFDLLCLMLSLFLFRIQQINPELAQALFDLTFKDMDRGLREAGVGDLGVPKHMKRMLQGFYGRAASYYEALEQQDTASLSAVLTRNLYAGVADAPSGSMAEWVQIAWQFLLALDFQYIYGKPDMILELVPSDATYNDEEELS